MLIRRYVPQDLDDIIRLFRETVHTVNAADYSPEQLDAWAPEDIDANAWDESLRANFAVVAIMDGRIAGFGDIDRSGHLERLYVSKDYQRRGVASQICDVLEAHFPALVTMTAASITAVPFFEKRGYVALEEQKVERNGVELTRYLMSSSAPDGKRAEEGVIDKNYWVYSAAN